MDEMRVVQKVFFVNYALIRSGSPKDISCANWTNTESIVIYIYIHINKVQQTQNQNDSPSWIHLKIRLESVKALVLVKRRKKKTQLLFSRNLFLNLFSLYYSVTRTWILYKYIYIYIYIYIYWFWVCWTLFIWIVLMEPAFRKETQRVLIFFFIFLTRFNIWNLAGKLFGWRRQICLVSLEALVKKKIRRSFLFPGLSHLIKSFPTWTFKWHYANNSVPFTAIFQGCKNGNF